MSTPCPSSICGVWRQDWKRCESLCPLLTGLGMPLLSIACPVADSTRTTLRISCPQRDELLIVNKTLFGRNPTSVPLSGEEVETATRGGRKKFMLSGATWYPGSVGGGGTAQGLSGKVETSVVTCRLFQRGEGWSSRQERSVDPGNARVLVERNVLTRPGEKDVVIMRYFDKTDEVVDGSLGAVAGAGAGGKEGGKAGKTPFLGKSGKKICCSCPETKKTRDTCLVTRGEEACADLIEAHKACLRAEGFTIA